jgi:D-alanyl-D-alanine carboxypeptidase/D-alanyl-D-alanine-endopeptidase (penicillin-binding protein 4)
MAERYQRAGVWRAALIVMTVLAVLVAAPADLRQASASTAEDTAAADSQTRRPWQQRLDSMIGDRNMSVSVRLRGSPLYRHREARERVPASNQKLLLTMALLARLPPGARLTTRVAAREVVGSTVKGNLWLIGRGDPSLTGGARFGDELPFRPARLHNLARKVKRAGVTRIRGSVVGAVSYYSHDWWAQGWRSHYPAEYAPLASAIAFEGNVKDGRHVGDPERRAAAALTRKLRALGVSVGRRPRADRPPAGLATVAAIKSVPLRRLLQYMNRRSSNFFAEMMGKRLAVAAGTRPGTIAGGARAVRRWAAGAGQRVIAHDASGLSYDNRVSGKALATLLDSRSGPASRTIRETLPRGGQGTLEKRLHGVRVRAKTGTLPGYSALSGYVYLERREAWASFSVLSRGMPKWTASDLEDRIVRLLEERAR